MTQKRGSKLNKTETVQVRFDPKLKWACELLAAKERRTLSSLVEWVMEKAVREMIITSDEGKPITAWQVLEKSWDEETISRLTRLAITYPDLLTNTERRISDVLALLVWFEESCMPKGNVVFFQPIAKKIWPSILACAEGEMDQEELYTIYREARMEFLAKADKPGSRELRDLVAQGAFNNHPQAKKLIAKLVETDEIPAA